MTAIKVWKDKTAFASVTSSGTIRPGNPSHASIQTLRGRPTNITTGRANDEISLEVDKAITLNDLQSQWEIEFADGSKRDATPQSTGRKVDFWLY